MFKGLVEKIERPITLQELVQCTKAKGRAAIECVVSIIHSICWHLPPKWLRKIIHNSITLFEIIICFQLFVCQVESVFLASFIRSQLTTPCCFFLLLDLALVETICCRKDLQEDRSNITKGTTDPEGWVEITSSYTNLDQISSSESRPSNNFKISNKHQHFD